MGKVKDKLQVQKSQDDSARMTEERIRGLVKNYLLSEEDGNWHEENVKEAYGHQHGADLILTGGKHKYTDIEKESFTKSGYSIVIEAIEGMCKQFSKENVAFDLQVRHFNDNNSIVSIYVGGNRKKEFRIGWDTHVVGSCGIFTSDDVDLFRSNRSGHSYSGLYMVREVNNQLVFDGGLSSIFIPPNTHMEAKTVAAAIWKINIEPYLL